MLSTCSRKLSELPVIYPVTKAAQEQATAHGNGSEMVSGFGPQQVFRFSSQAEIAILALR
jgi:hypothetical protein